MGGGWGAGLWGEGGWREIDRESTLFDVAQ